MEAQPINNQGWRVNSHEIIEEGVIYKDENVEVEAFPVPHGTWPNAWGYRFTTPDKVIVISGDTAYSTKLASYAAGADILLHEAISAEKLALRDDFWRNYHSKNHTTTHELGELASEAQPKILVVYHVLHLGASEKSMILEIAQKYDGEVIIGRDLDIF